jgi:hypothetical protein
MLLLSLLDEECQRWMNFATKIVDVPNDGSFQRNFATGLYMLAKHFPRYIQESHHNKMMCH